MTDAPMILAIDPGPTESACVQLNNNGFPVGFGKFPNEEMLTYCYATVNTVCERIRSYGMPIGSETLETCEWCGRFQQRVIAMGHGWHWLTRKDVVTALCGSARAKDANVRQSLIDRYGGKAAAIGMKKAPGPLYGIRADVWSALAVACVWQDRWRAGLVKVEVAS